MYHVSEILGLATTLSLPRHASHAIFCVHIHLNMPGPTSHIPSPYYLLPDKQIKLLGWSPAILTFLSPFRQMMGQHINWAMTTFFQIISNSSFYHLMLYSLATEKNDTAIPVTGRGGP
jgi:hypothetical protein